MMFLVWRVFSSAFLWGVICRICIALEKFSFYISQITRSVFRRNHPVKELIVFDIVPNQQIHEQILISQVVWSFIKF
jgi:hypothetical protein